MSFFHVGVKHNLSFSPCSWETFRLFSIILYWGLGGKALIFSLYHFKQHMTLYLLYVTFTIYTQIFFQAVVAALLMNIYIVGLNQLYDIEIDKVRSFRRTGLPPVTSYGIYVNMCVCIKLLLPFHSWGWSDGLPDGRCFSMYAMPCGPQLLKLERDMFFNNLSNKIYSYMYV